MTVGGDTLYFAYDAFGTPMSVTYNGTNYFYATNVQGDVTAILNTSGTAVVTYTYDAWGNILSTDGSMASSLGAHNPLRYRGYVFDADTGLYYLQSRYYDPELGRFLNADAFASTGQGLLGNNMFAYCRNNPVLGFDPYGEFDLIGAAAGFAVGATVSITSYVLTSGGEINVGEMLWAGAVGGVAGIAASVSVTGAFVAGGINGIYTFCTAEGTLEERVGSAVIAAMATTAGGALAFTGYDKLLGCVKATADIAYFIGSVGINYSVGQVTELASVGLQTLNKSSSQSTFTQNSSPSTKSRTTTEACRRKTWDIIQNMLWCYNVGIFIYK